MVSDEEQINLTFPPDPPEGLGRLRENFQRCQWCGTMHVPDACYRVKKMEFYEDGKAKSVEFWSWNEWPHERVVFYDDIQDDEPPE